MGTAEKTKVAKLLALALDSAATDGEAHNAAVAAIRIMRANRLSLSDIGVSERVVVVEQKRAAWWESVDLPFGKYKGKRLGFVVDHDPSYLRWMVLNLSDLRPPFRDALHAACYSVGIFDEEE